MRHEIVISFDHNLWNFLKLLALQKHWDLGLECFPKNSKVPDTENRSKKVWLVDPWNSSDYFFARPIFFFLTTIHHCWSKQPNWTGRSEEHTCLERNATTHELNSVISQFNLTFTGLLLSENLMWFHEKIIESSLKCGHGLYLTRYQNKN